MSENKYILIINNDESERKIISDMISKEFITFEAHDEHTLLKMIEEHYMDIDCLLVDMNMFVSVVNILKENKHYTKLPIIMLDNEYNSENESKCFKAGAWDYINRPFLPETLNHRINNVIERSKIPTYNKLKYVVEYDSLTNIFNYKKLMSESEKLIAACEENNFAIIRFDINKFSLINSFFGTEEGNNLLKYVAQCLKDITKGYEHFAYGRIEADVFGLCITFESREEIIQLVEQAVAILKKFNDLYGIIPCFGIYVVSDRTVPISIMFDCAAMAEKKCKGNYVDCYEFYNDAMRDNLEKEQQIINEMYNALQTKQFDVYIQPKYNIVNNTPAGGEALVRWIHPEKGIISPGVFIPIFEKNGFIAKLDYYVWERVCQILRKWIDEGKEPQPISVNVSRVNLYNPNFVDKITNLVDKYKIPHGLLHLELTESAYTDNPAIMKNTISQLQKEGFIILMDDFGSGYSSLNMLKEIPVDILKIDMRFFSEDDPMGRGQNIIASVIRLSKWLNIPAVAEGVETAEQVRFLREIGCEYVQGFYYARPMTADKYIEYVSGNTVVHFGNEIKSGPNEMLITNQNMEVMFSNMFQAMAFYEYKNGEIEIIRVNDAYFDMFNFKSTSFNSKNVYDLIVPEYVDVLIDSFEKAVNSSEAVDCEYRRYAGNNEEKWISIKLKYIDTVAGKHVLLGCLTDVTAQKQIEFELQKYQNAISMDSALSNRILIVDDSTVNREYLKLLFEKQFSVYEAENGQQALDVLEKLDGNIDIIMLDISMPVMDGVEFLNKRNNIKKFAHIPVIIISADDTPEQQAAVLAMGANDYVVKPFVDEVVIRRVNNVIESDHRFKDILQKYNAPKRKEKKDELMGICNCHTAKKLIDNILAVNENRHGLIVIDIDNLRKINEQYGVNAGDNVLISLSSLIKQFFRASDIVARIGDDEICIFMNSISYEASFEEKCRTLQNAISTYDFEGINENITCCIGATLSLKNDNYNDMYLRAAQALHKAQCIGRNTYYIAQLHQA